jgi:hypothetical protein
MPEMAFRVFALAAVGTLLWGGAAAAQDDLLAPGIIGVEAGMSPAEFDSARMSFFNRADSNADLVLSLDELNQALMQYGSRLFEGSDLNGDGSISLDEYLDSGTTLFTQLDTDGDGALTSGEM